jgi:hypothetical protein
VGNIGARSPDELVAVVDLDELTHEDNVGVLGINVVDRVHLEIPPGERDELGDQLEGLNR